MLVDFVDQREVSPDDLAQLTKHRIEFGAYRLLNRGH
jgi:hypothetical protein